MTSRVDNSRAGFTVSPGATLGQVPNRAAKELVAAGLRDLGIDALYIVERVTHDEAQPFKVVTAGWASALLVSRARGFVAGVLFAMQPPDPLAADVKLVRNEWAHLHHLGGRAVAGWAFCCGDPGCVVTASVNVADGERAATQMQALGWRTSATAGWLCPDHANGGEVAA